jgi:hypothetical protein
MTSRRNLLAAATLPALPFPSAPSDRRKTTLARVDELIDELLDTIAAAVEPVEPLPNGIGVSEILHRHSVARGICERMGALADALDERSICFSSQAQDMESAASEVRLAAEAALMNTPAQTREEVEAKARFVADLRDNEWTQKWNDRLRASAAVDRLQFG